MSDLEPTVDLTLEEAAEAVIDAAEEFIRAAKQSITLHQDEAEVALVAALGDLKGQLPEGGVELDDDEPVVDVAAPPALEVVEPGEAESPGDGSVVPEDASTEEPVV